MSSGEGLGVGFVVLGVGEEGAVDDVGELAFEGSDGFGFGVAVGEALFQVGLGVGVAADLGDGDAVEGGVDLTVATPVQSEPLRVG